MFVNYLRKLYTLDYDEVMGIYNDVWIAVRNNILKGNVKPNTQWKAYILRMGCNQASNHVTRRLPATSIDDETFNREAFEKEYEAQQADTPIYQDLQMKELLANEMCSIPTPCNVILRLYYYENLSMTEIANTMKYSNSRTAITTKNRCLDRLKERVKRIAIQLGIL